MKPTITINKFLGVLICLIFVLSACVPGSQSSPAVSQETVPPPAEVATNPPLTTSTLPVESAPEPDLETLKNTTYNLDILKNVISQSGGNVTLYNGVFEQQIPNASEKITVQYLDGKSGDINGDGIKDALALVAVRTGGSGTFIHLVAFLFQDGELHQAAVKMLGDRVKVNSIQIQDGRINLNLLEHGPNDGMCCPSQEAEKALILVGDQLLTKEQAQVKPIADQAIQALKDQDWSGLAALVHPEDGVRFSPYGNIKDTDLVFKPDELLSLPASEAVYNWGNMDGSGEPINMTFLEYFKRFVFNDNFTKADQVGFDQIIGTGNTINNTEDFYPGDVVVEYYLAGKDPQYGGLDWRSLRLVFKPEGDTWRLVGIIHDEWTI